MMLVIQFLYTQKQKFHFRKYFSRYSKKYLSNATQLTYLIKTCIFLMLLYLCFATRKNYALIGSIISSIHTQNGFEHQQFIVQGVKKLCYFRKCQYLNNQINAPISNLWKLCIIVITPITVYIVKLIRLNEIINMIMFLDTCDCQKTERKLLNFLCCSNII